MSNWMVKPYGFQLNRWLYCSAEIELSLVGTYETFIPKANCPEISHVQILHIWVLIKAKYMKHNYIISMSSFPSDIV